MVSSAFLLDQFGLALSGQSGQEISAACRIDPPERGCVAHVRELKL